MTPRDAILALAMALGAIAGLGCAAYRFSETVRAGRAGADTEVIATFIEGVGCLTVAAVYVTVVGSVS